ncbi:MAG: hypothetical protein AAF264_02010 [Pseudomonadota bacterium]
MAALSDDPKLIFGSGFGGSTDVELVGGAQRPQILGSDPDYGFDWAAFFGSNQKVDPIQGGRNPEKYETSVETAIGPDGKETEVLQMFVGDGSRFEGEPPAPFRTEFNWLQPADAAYGRYWMKIDDDPENMDEWRLVQEVKGGEREFAANGNLINTWRANIATIERDGEIVWRLKVQDHSLDENGVVVNDTYVQEFSTTAVPLDEWMLIESAYEKGTDDGYFWFAVNGETIFEFEGRMEALDLADE